jgi:hypothetical protein
MTLPNDSLDDIREIRNDVKEIRKILLGNGEVGICEQIRHLESVVDTLQADLTRRIPLTPDKWRLIVISSLFTLILILWHIATGEWHNFPAIWASVKQWLMQ